MFSDIKTRLDYYVDDTVSPTVAVTLFNQCNEDLSPIAGYAQTVETDYDYTSPMVTLPTDLVQLIELEIKPESATEYTRIYAERGKVHYLYFGDSIEIPDQTENATLRLKYFAQLPAIASLSESPVIPARFHDLYALFAAAKYYQHEQQLDMGAKTDYWNEYLTKRAELEKVTQRMKHRSNPRKIINLYG
jgi:hypothetical protein